MAGCDDYGGVPYNSCYLVPVTHPYQLTSVAYDSLYIMKMIEAVPWVTLFVHVHDEALRVFLRYESWTGFAYYYPTARKWLIQQTSGSDRRSSPSSLVSTIGPMGVFPIEMQRADLRASVSMTQVPLSSQSRIEVTDPRRFGMMFPLDSQSVVDHSTTMNPLDSRSQFGMRQTGHAGSGSLSQSK